METTLRSLFRYFLGGLVFIVPLAVTVYFIVEFFNWLDNLLGLPYPGLGFAIILVAITLIGYLTSNLAFKTITQWFDQGINRIPMVKLIYSSIKDLIGAFVGDKKKFSKPVLVLMNKENQLYQIGFVTQHDLSELGLKDMISVYLPHAYNFSGDHFVISKDRVTSLNISGPVAMKYVVSGGVSGFKPEA
ncbi:MAG: DUF502 domain-containing protein [Cyclobacteriaceae bacterium]|jgi:uncharacterized membrane protein|nr:DUF502 domain-containing protein [Cyclobacteriaceae bacterium]